MGIRNKLARAQRVEAGGMIWAVWLEFGKSGGNPHLHATICSHGNALNTEQTMNAIRRKGVNMGLPGKINVRVFRKGLNTFEYLCKELDSPWDSEARLHDGCWPITSDGFRRARKRHPDRR